MMLDWERVQDILDREPNLCGKGSRKLGRGHIKTMEVAVWGEVLAVQEIPGFDKPYSESINKDRAFIQPWK